jgi:esterase
MEPIPSHTRIATAENPEAWLYLLHGIYGSGRNWASLARQLVAERPEWGVILVDLRLHGGSAGFSPPHTLRACVDDLLRLEADLGRHPRRAWVVDSTLRTGEPSGTAWDVIGIVRSLPTRFASRDEVVDAMVEHGYERGVGQWLAMNLERASDGFVWKLDWDGVEEMLRDYFRADVWAVVDEPPDDVELHFIRATESTSIDAESRARIRLAAERTGRVSLYEVAGGHWLNVENPDGVLRLLTRFLPGGTR